MTAARLETMIYVGKSWSHQLPELDMALELASGWCKEVEAVIVDTDDLLRVAALPFTKEVLRYPAAVREFSRQRLQHQQTRSTIAMRERFTRASETVPFKLEWRSLSLDALRWREAVDKAFTLLFIGQITASGRQLIEQKISALYCFFDGSAPAVRGLQYAAVLAYKHQLPLVVLVADGFEKSQNQQTVLSVLSQMKAQASPTYQLIPVHNPDSMASLKLTFSQCRNGLLFLPNTHAFFDPEQVEDLLTAVQMPVILLNP